MAVCRFCGKSFEGTLEDHLRNKSYDTGMLARYFAMIDERLKALENNNK
jgi:hypothetical protein